jgi:hypothetical protein
MGSSAVLGSGSHENYQARRLRSCSVFGCIVRLPLRSHTRLSAALLHVAAIGGGVEAEAGEIVWTKRPGLAAKGNATTTLPAFTASPLSLTRSSWSVGFLHLTHPRSRPSGNAAKRAIFTFCREGGLTFAAPRVRTQLLPMRPQVPCLPVPDSTARS